MFFVSVLALCQATKSSNRATGLISSSYDITQHSALSTQHSPGYVIQVVVELFELYVVHRVEDAPAAGAGGELSAGARHAEHVDGHGDMAAAAQTSLHGCHRHAAFAAAQSLIGLQISPQHVCDSLLPLDLEHFDLIG